MITIFPIKTVMLLEIENFGIVGHARVSAMQ